MREWYFQKTPKTETVTPASQTGVTMFDRGTAGPKGTLVMTRDEVLQSSSMPVSAPAYPLGPFIFRAREYLVITYETGPEAIRRALPEPLEPAPGSLAFYEWIKMPDPSGPRRSSFLGSLTPRQRSAGTFSIPPLRPLAALGRAKDVEDAPRDALTVDSDTQGEPGQPPIVETILKKIDASQLFVADMTYTAQSSSGKHSPDPNVLIEYGWALKGKSHSRIISVMNTAYGKPPDIELPFDLRYARWPLGFHLPEDATPELKTEVKRQEPATRRGPYRFRTIGRADFQAVIEVLQATFKSRDGGRRMSQEQNHQIAEKLLAELGRFADAEEIAKLFSADVVFEIAGDVGALPWIGRNTGRSAASDFVRDTRRLMKRERFDVHDILVSEDRAVIVGSFGSRIIATGKIIESDFALILGISNGEIKRFSLLKDSFAVSRAARE